LKKVVFPGSVGALRDRCFAGCNLVEIGFCKDFRLERLPTGYCGGCELLEHFFIPASVRSIGAKCFVNCSALAKLELPASVEMVESGFLENSGITSLEFA
jgi:hypothetical protein